MAEGISEAWRTTADPPDVSQEGGEDSGHGQEHEVQASLPQAHTTMKELEDSTKSIKHGKATDVDSVAVELFKCTSISINLFIHNLQSKAYEESEILSEWTQHIVQLTYNGKMVQRNVKTEQEYYSLIILLNHIKKNRIKKKLKKCQNVRWESGILGFERRVQP